MKKTLLINGLAILLVAFMILGASLIKAKEPRVIETQNVVYKNPDAYRVSYTKGTSMEQYGLINNHSVKIYYNRTCREGDNCAFRCLVDKCIAPDKNIEFFKRLISIKDECYWFEGNQKPIPAADGGSYRSFDSRDYGCLKPSEFEMQGVVISNYQVTPF